MDITLQNDLQAVAEKDQASFQVVIGAVPVTPPPTETVNFAPGVAPVVVSGTGVNGVNQTGQAGVLTALEQSQGFSVNASGQVVDQSGTVVR